MKNTVFLTKQELFLVQMRPRSSKILKIKEIYTTICHQVTHWTMILNSLGKMSILEL